MSPDGDAPGPTVGSAAPRRIDGLRLERLLGSGGWGTVYEAVLEESRPWASAGDRVAVKFLRAERFADPGAIARFVREGRIGRAVDHPAVVRILDAGIEPSPEGPRHFLVMEFVEGRTFGRLIRELGRVPEALLRELATQAAEALAAIHAAGAVHRDLKPSNLLITPDHRVKVMDLGVAALLDESERLTATGLFVGTLDYAAPEQLSGAAPAPAADLYALGVVLHEAAAGVRVFDAPSTRAVVARHLHERPPKLGSLVPQVTPFFEELVATLLEKDPERRFTDAAALAAVLRDGEASAWWRERESALREGPAAGRLRRSAVARDTPFTDRTGEMRELLALAAEARAGRGRVALVEGEAGAGKSRLIEEMLRRVLAEEPRTAVIVGSDAPGARRGGGALARGLLEHLGEARLAERLSELLGALAPWAPSLAALLRGLPAPPGAPAVDGESLPALLQAVAASLCREQPLIWVVEDLHFAGAEARTLFAALAERGAALPMLLVGTARAGAVGEELAPVVMLPHAARVAVPRLRDSDVLAMIAEVGGELGVDAAGELRRQIVAKADGNPFFVTEMLRELRRRHERTVSMPAPDSASGAAGRSSGSRRILTIEIPESVRELLGARLRGLAEADRTLLDLGAVEGFEFDPELLASVRGQGLLEVLERLAAVERRHGLLAATGTGFRFDHHLLQELVYEELPPALRRAYHRALAGAHRKLGDRVRRGGAGGVAVVDHELRGGFLPPDEELLPALDRLAAAYETDRLLELIALALELVPRGRPELRAALRLREADRLFLLHRVEEHRTAAADAQAAAQEAGDRAAVARALFEQGRMLIDSGEAEARPLLERALAAARDARDEAVEARIEGALGHVALRAGEMALAYERYSRQVELGRLAGDAEVEAEGEYYVGEALIGLARNEEARVVLSRSVETCRRHGYRRIEARASQDLALAWLVLGHYVEARKCLERALELSELLGYREGAAAAHANSTFLALIEGDLQEANRHSALHFALIDAMDSPFHLAYATLYRGEIRRLEGRGTVGEEDFRRALSLFEQLGFQFGVLEAAFHLGRQLAEEGRRDEAVPVLELAERTAIEHSLPDPAPLPTIYLALLGERPPEAQTVPSSMQLPLAMEAHWVLSRAGAGGLHEARAHELLDRISKHLSGEALSRFRRTHPVARALSVKGGE